ncbi:hypothetical protein PtA15_13A484 [Puccinia triticina]|uniref:Uncharacterized protein n=1 Tax=Puccinia triticina TaxID=208348 RepID=A0ABY7D1T2_9BASI|nr:uncharacterized protein PtA15_13A484 [Puccinia triticina]WAQ91083.1 hypothetical protein PtA15_13A484 [Puccinia triticina]
MARAGATLPGRPAQMAGHREEHKLASLRECVPAIPGRVHALTNRLLSGPARIAQGRRQQEGIIHTRGSRPQQTPGTFPIASAPEGQRRRGEPRNRDPLPRTARRAHCLVHNPLQRYLDAAARKTPRKAGAAAHE